MDAEDDEDDTYDEDDDLNMKNHNSNNNSSDAIQSAKMQQIINDVNNDSSDETLYTKKFISSIKPNVLNAEHTSAINALEAGLQLLMDNNVSVQLIDNIIQQSALFETHQYTTSSDIVEVVTRYNTNLNSSTIFQTTTNAIPAIIKKVVNKLDETKRAVASILFKPPETLLLYINPNGQIIVYDSKCRTGLNGAHILIFESDIYKLCKYFINIWPYVKVNSNDYKAQQVNMITVSIYQLKHDGENPLNSPNFAIMGKELQTINVNMKPKWFQMYQDEKKISNKKRRATKPVPATQPPLKKLRIIG